MSLKYRKQNPNERLFAGFEETTFRFYFPSREFRAKRLTLLLSEILEIAFHLLRKQEKDSGPDCERRFYRFARENISILKMSSLAGRNQNERFLELKKKKKKCVISFLFVRSRHAFNYYSLNFTVWLLTNWHDCTLCSDEEVSSHEAGIDAGPYTPYYFRLFVSIVSFIILPAFASDFRRPGDPVKREIFRNSEERSNFRSRIRE